MKLPPKQSCDQRSNGTFQAGTRETYPKLYLLLTTGFDPSISSMKNFQINRKTSRPSLWNWKYTWMRTISHWWSNSDLYSAAICPKQSSLGQWLTLSPSFLTPACNLGPTRESQMCRQTHPAGYTVLAVTFVLPASHNQSRLKTTIYRWSQCCLLLPFLESLGVSWLDRGCQQLLLQQGPKAIHF